MTTPVLDIQTREIDPETMSKLREVAEGQHTLSFTANELAMLTTALGGLKRTLTRGIRQADEGQVEMIAEMLGDASTLENRIGATLREALAHAFPDGPPEAAFAPAAPPKVEPKPAPDNYAYL